MDTESQLITINIKNYFEGSIYILGCLFLPLSFLFLFTFWYISPFLLFLGVLIISTKYQLIVDLKKQQINDFLNVLGSKKNKVIVNYSRLEFIYITESKYSQRMNLASISSTVSSIEYIAFLKSDVGNHIIGEHKNLQTLQTKLEPIALKLGLEVKAPTAD